MSKAPKGGGGKPPPASSGSGLAGIADPEQRRAAQAAALARLVSVESDSMYVHEDTGRAGSEARDRYATPVPGARRSSPAPTPVPTTPSRSGTPQPIPSSGGSGDLGGYSPQPMSTGGDRAGTEVPDDPFDFRRPLATSCDGGDGYQVASLEAAVTSVNRLNDWLQDARVLGDTEFYKRPEGHWQLAFALEELVKTATSVNFADPTPVASTLGTPVPEAPPAGPPAPAAAAPRVVKPPPVAPARDEDVAMPPADSLPNPVPERADKAPRIQPLAQRKKPIRPFQPPPINMQTKPKASYAKATARSPVKKGPVRPGTRRAGGLLQGSYYR